MVMKLVLDTNAYSGLMRGQAEIVCHVRSADQIYLPAPVVGELLFGFRRGNRLQQNKQQLQQFVNAPSVMFVPTDKEVCDRYALVLHQLKSKGSPIPTNNIWIAAHTLALGADLLSSDHHFAAIDGLSWIEPDE
ncbi:MAG TPA: type II toxin-antitoxin system VapC family toxin [Verrucomicrobiales bacterium]|nr:type II toxin-antitoxin system VapC family toxin [Verrucomicrobiales bacterium]HIL69871.1 type II toxin-antitoxin system VapC family toxin [Verrucomicrobiota bacterium]